MPIVELAIAHLEGKVICTCRMAAWPELSYLLAQTENLAEMRPGTISPVYVWLKSFCHWYRRYCSFPPNICAAKHRRS